MTTKVYCFYTSTVNVSMMLKWACITVCIVIMYNYYMLQTVAKVAYGYFVNGITGKTSLRSTNFTIQKSTPV